MPHANATHTINLPLGRTVVTAAVNEWLTDNNKVWPHIQNSLSRHKTGDWGEVGPEDWESNNAALTNGGRLLSAYTFLDRKVWIITEWDRSVTTVLFPEDY